jgi:hypothetical protein
LKYLKGIQILDRFEARLSGVQLVDYTADPNSFNETQVVQGTQAAVSVGAGVTTQELNDALEMSSLFTVGAAAGGITVAGGWVSDDWFRERWDQVANGLRPKEADMAH